MLNNLSKEGIQFTLTSATQQLDTISDTALLDAEVLLCHILKKNRSHLRAWPEKALSLEEHNKFQQLLDQRIRGEPIAYISGKKEFWSREFKVSPNVLIPRPDTELLIELSLNIIKNKVNPRLIDLGTGSGNIAITLAAERPDSDIIATDVSNQALKIAKYNAKAHQIKNIHFIQSDWFDNILQNEFDLVISNPPYIASNDPHLSQGDVRFEPDCALVADDKGLKDIRMICNHARDYLKSKGRLLIEHGYDQQAAVQTIFDEYQFYDITTHNDLSGNPRVTTGLK
jgi:release factor glutamine methyltransferase